MVRLVRDDIARQTGEKFFVDKNVFGRCWGEIQKWLHWTSLIYHMFHCHLSCDFIQLLHMTKE